MRLRLYEGEAAYLLEAQSGFGNRSPIFHVLFGGQRKPFPAGFEGGHGYLVSTHSETSPQTATRVAIQIARSSELETN